MNDMLFNGLSFVPLFPNWIELMETKDTDAKQLAFIKGIIDAFRGEEPPKPQNLENPHGTDYARRDGYLVAHSCVSRFYAGFKGGISKSEKKAEAARRNGRLGGRPKTQQNPQPKTEETEGIKPKKPKNPTNINKNNIYNIQNNGGDNNKEVSSVSSVFSPTPSSPLAAKADATADSDAAEMSTPTRQQAMDAAALMGIKPDIVEMWLEHMRQWDWHFGGGGRVTAANFRMSLSSFAARERRDRESDAPPESNVPPVTERQREGMKRLREVINI